MANIPFICVCAMCVRVEVLTLVFDMLTSEIDVRLKVIILLRHHTLCSHILDLHYL